MFAKIFHQIFDSSIAEDYVVRHVFMDLLVLCDRDGVVDMTIQAIARRTNTPGEIIRHGIEELSKPDRESRSAKEDGRRLVPIDSHRDWGWQIVNYQHYRTVVDDEARRAYFRDKKREYRDESQKSKEVLDGLGHSKMSTQADIDVEERKHKQKATTATADAAKKHTPPKKPASAAVAKSAMDYCHEFSISSQKNYDAIQDAIDVEGQHSADGPQAIAERMIAARQKFEAIPKLEREFDWPVVAFITQGIWKRREQWRKDGQLHAGDRKLIVVPTDEELAQKVQAGARERMEARKKVKRE
jgi:hypothetical protein